MSEQKRKEIMCNAYQSFELDENDQPRQHDVTLSYDLLLLLLLLGCKIEKGRGGK